jgi:hypothetical protein
MRHTSLVTLSQVVQSCIGTKYTSRFGTLMAVSAREMSERSVGRVQEA